MSDPVTQAEIEDVLSSIRRLVSEDGRSVSRPVPPMQEVPKPATRLVLTPALRVPAGRPAEVEDADVPASPGADSPMIEGSAAGFTSTDQMHEEDVQGEGLDPDGWDVEILTRNEERYTNAETSSDISHEVELELSQAEVFAFSRNESGEEIAPVAFGSGDPLADEASGALESEPATEVSPENSEAAPWLQPGATLFEAAIPAEQEATPTGEAAEAIGAEARIDEAHIDGAGIDETGIDEESGIDEMAAEAGFETDPTSSQRVSAVVQKIAELEAKVARSQEQWEPDGASSDPYAGTNIETLANIETLEWQDHIYDAPEIARNAGFEAGADHSASEAEAVSTDSDVEPGIEDAAQLAQDAVAEETLEAVAALTGDESYLDEDSLRELVADIVRSELQGALGERITRNVRKLVRREIQRALAAQDLI